MQPRSFRLKLDDNFLAWKNITIGKIVAAFCQLIKGLVLY